MDGLVYWTYEKYAVKNHKMAGSLVIHSNDPKFINMKV